MRLGRQQSGAVLLSMIIVLPFLIVIVGNFTQLAVNSFRVGRKDQFQTHAQFAADAGIDKAIEELNQDETWLGTGTDITLKNDSTAKSTYIVTVVPTGLDTRRVTSIGKSYLPTSPTTVDSQVKIEAELAATRSQGFSIVAGVGGLILSNSAKVLGGDVFVNGKIDMTNTSQIGLQLSPIKLDVAHRSCPMPADSNFPRVCNTGENGEPIFIDNSAHIYGEVRANNQTTTDGMSDPGLVASSGVDPQPLPEHDRAAQKAAVLTSTTGALASCTNQGGSRIWPANYKIVGDVKISHNCSVIVQGDVWITGKLEMENQATMVVVDLLATEEPSIMIDGLGTKIKNSATIVSNLTGTGVQIITYWSDSACSPDCANVTGADLFNSQDDTTIELDNSASGAQSIFYSKWTKVLVQNSGQIGALVGQTIELKNTGTITFGSNVGGGSTFWTVDGYKRVY